LLTTLSTKLYSYLRHTRRKKIDILLRDKKRKKRMNGK
jgi:hypothetical protein